jgi:hypothetical protein
LQLLNVTQLLLTYINGSLIIILKICKDMKIPIN